MLLVLLVQRVLHAYSACMLLVLLVQRACMYTVLACYWCCWCSVYSMYAVLACCLWCWCSVYCMYTELACCLCCWCSMYCMYTELACCQLHVATLLRRNCSSQRMETPMPRSHDGANACLCRRMFVPTHVGAHARRYLSPTPDALVLQHFLIQLIEMTLLNRFRGRER